VDIGTPQQIESTFDKVLAGIDSGAGYRAKKKIADEFINRGFGPKVEAPVRAQAQFASVVKKNIDDIAGTISPQLDVAGIKYDYHTMKPLFSALEREMAKITATEAGSPTAARAFTKQLLMGGGEGGAGGALLGTAATTPDDPDRWKKILTAGIGGVVLGGAANKIIPSFMNKAGGQIAGRLSDLITPQGIEAVTKGAQAIAPQVSTMIGKIPPQAMGDATQGVIGGQQMSTGDTFGTPQTLQPIAPQIGNFTPPPQDEMAPVAPDGTQPIQNAPPILPPKDQAQVDFQEAGKPPQKAGKWNDAFVEARIQEKWKRYERQYGEIPYEEYKDGALRATQNLDPALPATWQAMFDDKETGTKLYNGYMNLQKLTGVDPASALNHYTRFWHKGPRISGEAQKKEDQDNAKLVQALSDMTKQPVKEIDSRLKMIAWDKGKTEAQRKQAVLDMIVNEGGIDVPLLVKMGLW
jgi:hypothetical protein